jgi:hypothetical protein
MRKRQTGFFCTCLFLLLQPVLSLNAQKPGKGDSILSTYLLHIKLDSPYTHWMAQLKNDTSLLSSHFTEKTQGKLPPYHRAYITGYKQFKEKPETCQLAYGSIYRANRQTEMIRDSSFIIMLTANYGPGKRGARRADRQYHILRKAFEKTYSYPRNISLYNEGRLIMEGIGFNRGKYLQIKDVQISRQYPVLGRKLIMHTLVILLSTPLRIQQ